MGWRAGRRGALPALLLALCLLALPAPAREAAAPYLAPSQLDLELLLPPPPARGSARQAADLAAVAAAERTRTPDRAAQAVRDADESVFTMFGAILGPAVTAATAPALDRLARRLGATEDVLSDPVKARYARPRPFLADPDLHPVLYRSASGSYPSGHSIRVTSIGLALAAILPERRAEIAARMDDYMESRVIGGAHYPTDTEAGARAGTAIDAVLFNDPEFARDLAQARAEVRGALGLGGAR